MILEAEVARSLGVLGQVGVGRLTRCLKGYNLPVSLDDPRIKSVPASKQLGVEKLLDIMRIDKKNSGPAKKIVILSRIGKTYEEKATVVADAVIAKTLSEAAKVIPGSPSKNPVHMATPGSKSISNRALVLAALGEGTCRLKNLLHSDDTQVMMNALLELKVRFLHILLVTELSLTIYLSVRAPNSLGRMVVKLSSLKVAKAHSPSHPKEKRSTSETPAQPHVSLPQFVPSSRDLKTLMPAAPSLPATLV